MVHAMHILFVGRRGLSVVKVFDVKRLLARIGVQTVKLLLFWRLASGLTRSFGDQQICSVVLF